MLAADTCTAAVGTAVGVSVSVTFVVSFSMGVLVALVLCYISRRSKETSHKPRNVMEMNTNTAYQSPASYSKNNDCMMCLGSDRM